MLININDPSRYYIGSSVNLKRRLSEYFLLTTGARAPGSSAEREIALTPAEGSYSGCLYSSISSDF